MQTCVGNIRGLALSTKQSPNAACKRLMDQSSATLSADYNNVRSGIGDSTDSSLSPDGDRG